MEKRMGNKTKGNKAAVTKRAILPILFFELPFVIFQKQMTVKGSKAIPIILNRPDKPSDNVDKLNLCFLSKYNDRIMKKTAKMSN